MIKTKKNHEDLTYLNSYFSKVLKRKCGKGPGTCHTTLINNKMFIHLKDFITPAEEVLINSNEEHLVYKMRSVILETIFKEVKDEIANVLGISFTSMQYDWNFNKNTGLLMLEELHSHKENKSPLKNNQMYNDIQSIFLEVHKKTNDIKIVNATSSIYYIEYSGFMTHIEQFLYQKGYDDILDDWCKDVKNTYELNKRLFEKYLHISIEEVFVILDYKRDKGMVVFYVK